MQKRKTIYIHIGTPKTGTTSIQRFLTQNNTLLAQKGIFYPIAGRLYSEDGTRTYNISNAATAINGHLLCDMKLVNDEWPCDIKLFKKQLDIFAKSAYSTMVLSEENLFCYLNSTYLFLRMDALWQLLSNYDVKIIIYFRKSIEYITSLWKETVKLRHFKTLENYLETLDYAESLAVVHNLLTRVDLDNIIVRTFEPTIWVNNDLIDDFLSALNIENTDEFLPLKTQENKAFSRDYCERILYVNRYLKERIGVEDIYGINEMIPRGDNPQTILESLPDEMIKEISDKYYPLECEIAKKFLSKDELFLTKYPKIYQTKRSRYQLNITSQEITELNSVISYGVQWQILKQQEFLQKNLAKQEELLQETLTQQKLQKEQQLKSSFFYILSKPLRIIFNVIFYKSTRKYIMERLFHR